MKRTLIAAIVLALGFVGSAFAADYVDYCTEAACHPFSPSNSYVVQKAVTLAYNNNAAVGDSIYLIDDTGTRVCESKYIEWVVNYAPTLNSTHLTLENYYCITNGNQ